MKKMSKGMLMTALICGAVYLGGSPVYANELQEFALDEYVVTAARTETKLVDTPANISVVDAKTIEERHYQDVSEVLKDVPGANVIDTGSGAMEKAISLNGDTRVLILVDGRRMDFASGTSTGRASFDMGLLPDVTLIERVEVLKGTGGALYGSDAVGGVINIITKKADGEYGKVNVGVGSNDTRDFNVMYSAKEGKTGVTLSASKNKQGYFKYKDAATNTTKRWPENSKLEGNKVSLNVTQDLDDYTNIEVGYDYNKYEGFSLGKINDSYGLGEIKKVRNDIYAKLNWTLKKTDVGYLQIYHNKYEYDSFNHWYGTIDADITEKTKGIDFQQAITLSDNNKLIFGSSWYDSKVNNPGRYNESINNIAFFINDNWEFAPTWLLNTGLRYDNHSNSGDETTFSFGLNKKFNDISHAYLNWGQVFNAPTTGDLFNPDGGEPNLKPETGTSWTAGYNSKLNDKTSFGISYFESDLEDAIAWRDTGRYNPETGYNDWAVKNVDKQKKRGLEISLDHKVNENLDLSASYTYLRVLNDNGDGYNRDNGYVPNIYRLGIHYKENKWNIDTFLRYGSGAYDNQDFIPEYDYGNGYISPAYTSGKYVDNNYLTVDMAITYNANKDLSFYAKAYNLFNEAYSEFSGTKNGSYNYPAQSRRFIVGAEYKF